MEDHRPATLHDVDHEIAGSNRRPAGKHEQVGG